MTKSVTKIQDKDSRKRLSVVQSTEDPTKYGIVILNPDGSKIRGPQGEKGDAATIRVGNTTTGNPGTSASVENTGTSSDAVLNFTIPRGDKGDAGEMSVGTTSTLAPGSDASVENVGTSTNAILNFKIPRGSVVSVGSTTTGDAGTSASVSDSGSGGDVILNFTIPKGEKGDAATISVGTTSTGSPGSSASVSNSGTSSNAVFNFTIPRGDKGETGDTGNGISNVVATKSGKTTTVTISFTNGSTPYSFQIQDGQDGEGSGDVLGPSSSTDGNLALFDGITGKLIKNGGAIQDNLTTNVGTDVLSAKQGKVLKDSIDTINGKIPSAATTSNQLADKDFVNSSINSVAAYYITKNAQGDQFATYSELSNATTFYSGGVVRVPTRNDYTIVASDETHDNATTRYSYQGNGWEYQYTVNETALTSAQLNALNSGITSGKVSTYDGYATSKQDALVSGTNIKTINGNSILGNGNIDTPNTTYNDATQSTAGLMSASDKTKLDGIASGAQVNSITGVKGDAESTYRTGNVNITPANIGIENKAAASGGTADSLVSTGDKYNWNNKQDALTSQTAYTGKGSATKVAKISTNNLGQVTGISEVSISFPVSSVNGRSGAVTGLQEELESGTNIKTINGETLLGSGNIEISGADIHSLTEKNTVDGDDEIMIADSEDSYENKKVKLDNIGFLVGDLPAGEDISKGDVLFIENMISSVDDFDAVGFDNDVQKVSIKRVGNGVAFSQIQMYLGKKGTPTNDLSIRIETDNSGNPSGTLVDENAYGTVSQSDLTTSVASTIISLAGTITIAKGTVCHIVIGTESVSSSNYYIYGGKVQESRLFNIKQYDGTNWNNRVNNNVIYDISNASHISNFNVGGGQGYGFCFGDNGNYLYAITTVSNPLTIKRYALSTPYDVSTAVESGASFTSSGSSPGNNLRMTSDGKYFGFSKTYSSDIYYYVYEMPTAWNLSGATLKSSTNGNYSVDGNQGYFVAMNGLKMYTLRSHSSTTTVTEYTLSTPYDISTRTLVLTKNMSISSTIGGIYVPNDGKYVFLYQRNSSVYQFKMSTAGSIQTASFVKSVSIPCLGYGISFSEDGTKMLLGAPSSLGTTTYVSSYNVGKNFGNKVFQFGKADGLFESEVGKASALDSLFMPAVPMTAYRDVNSGKIVNYNLLFDKNQSGLIPGQKYYLSDMAGEISSSAGSNEFEVGVAIETTILKLG